MRILLDTNIIIHREASRVVNKDIGLLFNWLDKLNYEKWVHHRSIEEISRHQDSRVVDTMKVKIDNYRLHKMDSPDDANIVSIRSSDNSVNDTIDTDILKEVYSERFDFLITEDRNIHTKAQFLSIDQKVFTIDSFLEKVNAENPGLVDYNVLAVKKSLFGELNLNDSFFDSFKEDYNEFAFWFNRKAEDTAYVCIMDGSIKAFLYIKIESPNEIYNDVNPVLPPKKRMKIGTFKVESTGFKLGERFLKIIFDNALLNHVEELYVTIFERTGDQKRLVKLLEDWGFERWGVKTTQNGEESVFVRAFGGSCNVNNPKLTYPLVTRSSNKFIVSIYPQYHTDLLPDSILNNESPADYIDNEPFRNAISKVFISRSYHRNLQSGDLIVFYRTGGYYKSVVTTIAIVENVIHDIRDEEHFIQLCRKRSVFNNSQLKEHWNYRRERPFIVNFLHVYSFPKRINMKRLIELGVIPDVNSAPRGFEPLTDEQFNNILVETQSDLSFIGS